MVICLTSTTSVTPRCFEIVLNLIPHNKTRPYGELFNKDLIIISTRNDL